MPRGNPAVWKHFGASYADISANATSGNQATGATASLGSSASSTGDLRAQPPAGSPSTMAPRGAGSFVYQVGGRWGRVSSGFCCMQQSAAEHACGEARICYLLLVPSPATATLLWLKVHNIISHSFQTGWSIAPRTSWNQPAPSKTETKTQFKPPPEDYKRRVGGWVRMLQRHSNAWRACRQSCWGGACP